jgi:hypothetical protein
MNNWINLTPAYGRDYKSAKEVLKDFLEEKDFVLNTPFTTTYINKQQIEKGTSIQFRYSKLTKVFVHKMK